MSIQTPARLKLMLKVLLSFIAPTSLALLFRGVDLGRVLIRSERGTLRATSGFKSAS